MSTPVFQRTPAEWLLDQSRGAIKKRLGAKYDPAKLIELLGKMCKGAALTDQEVLDLAEMFIFLMEHDLNWQLGARIFRHYLGEGGPSSPSLLLGNNEILASSSFRSGVCSSHRTILEEAVKLRVLDTTGALFPRDPNTLQPKSGFVPDDQGQPINYSAQPSPLRAGGTETIYIETSVQVSSVEATELAAMFGAIGVVSKVNVKSTPDGKGNWTIEVQDWTTWAWDRGDFNGAGQPNTQKLPIDVSTFFGPEWIQEQVYQYIESEFGVKKECLESFIALDKYMRQLEDNTYQRTSVVTGRQVSYFPQFFMIYFAQWDFLTSTAECGAPSFWTISDPAFQP